MRVNKLDQTSDFLDEFTDEIAMVKETFLNFRNQCLPLVFDHKKRCFYFSLRYDLFPTFQAKPFLLKCFSFFKLYKRSPGCERNLRQHTNKCRFASNLKLPSIFPQTTQPTWFLDLILEGVWFWRWSQNEFVSLPSLSSQHQLFRWWAALIFSSFQILRPHAPLSLHSTKKRPLLLTINNL